MRFLDEEVLEVFVVHCDGATCESVRGYVCGRKRNRDLGALEPGRVEVVLPWHAILYSGGMLTFVIG